MPSPAGKREETTLEERRRVRHEEARRRALKRRAILIGVPVALLAFVVGAKLLRGGSSGTEEKETPAQLVARQRARENRAIDRVLGYTTFIKSGKGRKREVALTFDDGPSEYTDRVLRILRRTNTPATFLVIGSMVRERQGTLRKIVRQGQAVGNHTDSHPAMGTLDAVSQSREVDDQERAVKEAGARERRLFRPPYRSFDESTLELLAERKLLMVLWSVDTSDYESPDPREMAHDVLNQVEPGSIILMHDGGGDRTATVRALPDIIKGLKRRHLKPVTVPRLVLDDPPPRDQGMPEGTLKG